ncbi:MAG: ribose-phosphate pyrophosphokinase [Candidatus Levybacteria bacterium]|nr:ribose-phosphate pyrophosphokinase [Candidatus Levybacteria bacterium]
MPKSDNNNFILLTGKSNPALAKKIGSLFKKEVYEPTTLFADGEIRIRIPLNLRRRHVFIIQPTSNPVNSSIMELIFMVDAAKRASASEIIAVIPYFGYSRQDRKEMPRVPISSSVIAGMFEYIGIDRIVTVDIHSEQQQGFIKKPWDNLYGSYALIPAIKRKNLKDLVVASPDKGGMRRATGYAKLLGALGVALVYKERDIALNNMSGALDMVGDVKNKNVLLVDDMIDTGGTLVNAAEFLRKKGAKSVRAAVTHGLFSGDSLDRIVNSSIEEIIVSDTVALKDEVLKNSKVEVVSVAPLLAEVIRRIETGESISRDLIL